MINTFYKQLKEPILAKKLVQIAFNIKSNIGRILIPNNCLEEEIKILYELKKILSFNKKINISCIRVPIYIGHCISITIELVNNFSINTIYYLLSKFRLVRVSKNNFFDSLDSIGRDKIFVSKIRQGTSSKVLNLWIISDNLLVGAVSNAIKIIELYQKKYIL